MLDVAAHEAAPQGPETDLWDSQLAGPLSLGGKRRALIGAYYTGAPHPVKEEDMTVTQKASGHEDTLATALAIAMRQRRTWVHPGIACTPELSARWNEQIRESLESGRAITNPGRGSVQLSFGLDLNRTPALLTEGEDLTLQITWQDGEHWRNDPRWETDPGDRWDVHLLLSFAGDRVYSTASNYEFGRRQGLLHCQQLRVRRDISARLADHTTLGPLAHTETGGLIWL